MVKGTAHRRIVSILRRLSYKDHLKFRLGQEGETLFLQLMLDAGGGDADVLLGPDVRILGRKWRLSPHMIDSEIVQTAFLAVQTFEEHEIRERFKYKGEAIFSQHLDCDLLAEGLESGTLNISRRDT